MPLRPRQPAAARSASAASLTPQRRWQAEGGRAARLSSSSAASADEPPHAVRTQSASAQRGERQPSLKSIHLRHPSLEGFRLPSGGSPAALPGAAGRFAAFGQDSPVAEGGPCPAVGEAAAELAKRAGEPVAAGGKRPRWQGDAARAPTESQPGWAGCSLAAGGVLDGDSGSQLSAHAGGAASGVEEGHFARDNCVSESYNSLCSPGQSTDLGLSLHPPGFCARQPAPWLSEPAGGGSAQAQELSVQGGVAWDGCGEDGAAMDGAGLDAPSESASERAPIPTMAPPLPTAAASQPSPALIGAMLAASRPPLHPLARAPSQPLEAPPSLPGILAPEMPPPPAAAHAVQPQPWLVADAMGGHQLPPPPLASGTPSSAEVSLLAMDSEERRRRLEDDIKKALQAQLDMQQAPPSQCTALRLCAHSWSNFRSDPGLAQELMRHLEHQRVLQASMESHGAAVQARPWACMFCCNLIRTSWVFQQWVELSFHSPTQRMMELRGYAACTDNSTTGGAGCFDGLAHSLLGLGTELTSTEEAGPALHLLVSISSTSLTVFFALQAFSGLLLGPLPGPDGQALEPIPVGECAFMDLHVEPTHIDDFSDAFRI